MSAPSAAVFVPMIHRIYCNFGATEAGIIVEFTKRDTKHKINLKLSGKEKKDIRLNGNRILQKELVGTLNTVLFSPEDLQLIKGSPSFKASLFRY